MGRRGWLCMVGLLTGLLLTGCYEKPKATLYQPGVYQGASDPLVKLEQSPKQQDALKQRLQLVQMDR
jgi:hypothetical protein